MISIGMQRIGATQARWLICAEPTRKSSGYMPKTGGCRPRFTLWKERYQALLRDAQASEQCGTNRKPLRKAHQS